MSTLVLSWNHGSSSPNRFYPRHTQTWLNQLDSMIHKMPTNLIMQWIFTLASKQNPYLFKQYINWILKIKFNMYIIVITQHTWVCFPIEHDLKLEIISSTRNCKFVYLISRIVFIVLRSFHCQCECKSNELKVNVNWANLGEELLTQVLKITVGYSKTCFKCLTSHVRIECKRAQNKSLAY